MKKNNLKNNLMVGIVYLLLGVCLAIWAILTPEGKLNSLFCGFGFGLIPPGLVMIGKYFYWTQPDKFPKYQEKIYQENIILHDELKEKLRDKSGRIAYLLGLCVISFSIILFSILGALDIVVNSRLIIIYLGAFLLLQIITYVFIYYKLARRY